MRIQATTTAAFPGRSRFPVIAISPWAGGGRSASPPEAGASASCARLFEVTVRGLREDGITCIIISHKLNEIRAIADSVTILRDGQTIETLSLHDGSVTEAQRPGDQPVQLV